MQRRSGAVDGGAQARVAHSAYHREIDLASEQGRQRIAQIKIISERWRSRAYLELDEKVDIRVGREVTLPRSRAEQIEATDMKAMAKRRNLCAVF
jgi:hypothetical protein